MTSRILVPIDLDHIEKLDTALSIAAKAARDHGATVTYVGVIDPVPTASKRREGFEAQQQLDAFAEAQAKTHGILTDGHIALRGDLHLHVGREIIKAAEDADCDLIVMASHVPGFKDHFLTSNASYVATYAPMSVHVVR
ncbi:universal stress protein [Nioella aestuarii]|uniref:universal stress protein n=1 Tax=Nioella aestuarii TaxID=1662864 RepID=UPI003D7F2D23